MLAGPISARAGVRGACLRLWLALHEPRGHQRHIGGWMTDCTEQYLRERTPPPRAHTPATAPDCCGLRLVLAMGGGSIQELDHDRIAPASSPPIALASGPRVAGPQPLRAGVSASAPSAGLCLRTF